MNIINFMSEKTQLVFDLQNGYLEQILYNGKTIPIHSKLWSIETNAGDFGIADMTSFRKEECPDNIKLFWKSATASVTVTILACDGGKIGMCINAEIADNAIKSIKFPIIEGMSFKNESQLLIPWQNGHLIKNPVDTLLSKNAEVPFWMGEGQGGYVSNYPAGISFQYSTFYSLSDFGYYLATEDPDAYIKTYAFEYNREKHALNYSVTNYPENAGKTRSYCMPYKFVLKLFDGDWQDATKIYRNWAIDQKWCKQKLSERKLPENLVKTDLWRINHMDYELGTRTQEYFDTSVKIRNEIDCNLALHWYGWNMSQHDLDYPEYISNTKKAEGWPDELTKWNKRFDEEGIVKIPYLNARLWEKKLKSWKDAESSAIKDELGNSLKEPWYEDIGFDLRPICPTTAMWQNKVSAFCKEYGHDVGFDGVYLDQVASFNATLCFDDNHPHPAGGGTWWNDSYHNMLENVRNTLGKDSIITTESCCETYVDFFDVFLILDTCFQHTAFNYLTEGGNAVSVPLFSMIYGDYALSYGSACQFTDRTDRFEHNLIRNLLWGILPCVEGGTQAELNIPESKKKLYILKQAVDFYKDNKDVFLYGRLCEIPNIECETISLDWEIDDIGTYVDNVPAVNAAIWEDKSGNKQIFAYNFSDKTCSFTCRGKNFSVSAKNFSSYTLD